jgi:hypothetical protein
MNLSPSALDNCDKKLRSALIQVGVNYYDISTYPEEVWPALTTFCKLWNMTPPASPYKKGSRGSLWLLGLREINEAAAEFRADDLMEEYFREWDAYRQQNKLTNRIIESPKSIVGAVAAVAAKKRTQPTESPAQSAIRNIVYGK